MSLICPADKKNQAKLKKSENFFKKITKLVAKNAKKKLKTDGQKQYAQTDNHFCAYRQSEHFGRAENVCVYSKDTLCTINEIKLLLFKKNSARIPNTPSCNSTNVSTLPQQRYVIGNRVYHHQQQHSSFFGFLGDDNPFQGK